MHPLEELGAKIAHKALYVLMVAVPLSGWLWSSLAGSNVPVLWTFDLPVLVGENRAWYDLAHKTHQILAWLLASVLFLHIAGALKHHFIDKSHVLRRMMPGKMIEDERDIT